MHFKRKFYNVAVAALNVCGYIDNFSLRAVNLMPFLSTKVTLKI